MFGKFTSALWATATAELATSFAKSSSGVLAKFAEGWRAGNAPGSRHKRLILLTATCALLAAPLLVPSAARAVECVNGGAGPSPAGNDGGSPDNVACGDSAAATGLASSAFGRASSAAGDYSVAIGNASSASTLDSVAIGGSSAASGLAGTAIGQGSLASGYGSTAVGNSSTAGGDYSTASGTASTASGAGSTASGYNSTASGSSATAVGYGATAAYSNSAAFGAGATATATNQVAIGTASNTYKLSGLTSAASLAAQSGPVSLVTTDAAGHLATTNITLPDISGLQSTVTGLQSSVDVLQHQMRQSFEGTAMAISMGGSALPADKRFAISTNWGNFHGENAASVVAQMRLTDYAVANVGIGAGFAQGGIGSRAGVTFAW
jgi:hypothetical protein